MTFEEDFSVPVPSEIVIFQPVGVSLVIDDLKGLFKGKIKAG
jgi:hypothetical protein